MITRSSIKICGQVQSLAPILEKATSGVVNTAARGYIATNNHRIAHTVIAEVGPWGQTMRPTRVRNLPISRDLF
ncbi:MAG: hypothetical protein ACE5GS_10500 [Kiloniellaceae bacterium]